MAAVYVTAFVPAAARDAAEAAVTPYLTSSNAPGVYTFSVPLGPLSGPADPRSTGSGG